MIPLYIPQVDFYLPEYFIKLNTSFNVYDNGVQTIIQPDYLVYEECIFS